MGSGAEFRDFGDAFARSFSAGMRARGTPEERELRKIQLERARIELESLKRAEREYPETKAYKDRINELELEIRQLQLDAAKAGAAKEKSLHPDGAVPAPFSPTAPGPGSMNDAPTPNPGLAGGEKADLMNQRGDAAKVYVWPVTGTWAGKPGSMFGAGRYHREHKGVDLQAPDGSSVVAAVAGTVLGTKYSPGSAKRHTIGYQHELTILGDDGYIYRYAPHGGVSVRPGDRVKAGDPIGTIGAGHLHFEVIPPGSKAFKDMRGGGFAYSSGAIDPTKYFNATPGTRMVAGQPMYGGVTEVADRSGIPAPGGRPGLVGGDAGADTLADTGSPIDRLNPERPGGLTKRIENAGGVIDPHGDQPSWDPLVRESTPGKDYGNGTDVLGGGTNRTGIPTPATTPWAGGVDQTGGPNDFATRTGRTGQPALELPQPKSATPAPNVAALPDTGGAKLQPSGGVAGAPELPDTGGARLKPSFNTFEGGTATQKRGGKGLINLTDADHQALMEVAGHFGIAPQNLLAVIGYETIGTYNPDITSPTGYRGLIQFGPKEQKQFGYKPGMSFAEQLRGPVSAYLTDRGLSAGMGLPELYSIINAGSLTKDQQPRWGARDSNGDLRHHLTLISQQYMPAAMAWTGGTSLGNTMATGYEGRPVPVPNQRPIVMPRPRPTIGPVASYGGIPMSRPPSPFAVSPVIGMADGGVVPSRDELAMNLPPDARGSTNIEDRSGYDPTTGFSQDQYSGDGVDTQRGPDVNFDPGSKTSTSPGSDYVPGPLDDVITVGHHAVRLSAASFLGVDPTDTGGPDLVGSGGTDTLDNSGDTIIGGSGRDAVIYGSDSGAGLGTDTATNDANAGVAAAAEPDPTEAPSAAAGDTAIPAPGTTWDQLPAATAQDPNIGEWVVDFEKKLDPNGQMSEGMRHLAALGRVYQHFAAKGDTESAKRAARDMFDFYYAQYNQYQAIAEEALKSGDMNGAIKAAVKAWNNIPDGRTMSVREDGRGGFIVTYEDGKGETVEQRAMTPSDIAAQILGMTPKTFLEQLVIAGGGHMPSRDFYAVKENVDRTGNLSPEDRAKLTPKELDWMVRYTKGLQGIDVAKDAADQRKAGSKLRADYAKTGKLPSEAEIAGADPGTRDFFQKLADSATAKAEKETQTKKEADAVTKGKAEIDATGVASPETLNAAGEGGRASLSAYREQKKAIQDKSAADVKTAQENLKFTQEQEKLKKEQLGPAKIFSADEANTARAQIGATIDEMGDAATANIAPDQLVTLRGAALEMMQYQPDLPVETIMTIAFNLANGTGKYTVSSIPDDPKHVTLTDTDNGREIRMPRAAALDLTRIKTNIAKKTAPPPAAPGPATPLPAATPENIFPTPGQPRVTRPSEVRQ